MKKFLFILLFLPCLLFGQTQVPEDVRIQKIYVAHETPDSYTCGMVPTLLSLSKKRIYLDFYDGIYDFQITKRKRNAWYAIREYQHIEQEYVIYHTELKGVPVLVFLTDSERLAISPSNFCK